MTIILISSSLFDIAALTSSELTEAASVFTWRFSGMMVGNLLSTIFYRFFNPNLVVAAALFILGTTMASSIFITSLTVFSVVIGVSGVCTGLLVTGETLNSI